MGGRDARAAALAELFAQHAQALAGALGAAGYVDATDAVQEAFVQATVHWRQVARYDDPLQWVRRVAVNKARNGWRNSQRRHALEERLAAQPAPVSTSDEVHDDLTDAMARLPEQQRLACALFYFADLPVAQVADAMRISSGTVKYHLHAARASLASALEVPDGR